MAAADVGEGATPSEFYEHGAILIPRHRHTRLEENVGARLGCELCLVLRVAGPERPLQRGLPRHGPVRDAIALLAPGPGGRAVGVWFH